MIGCVLLFDPSHAQGLRRPARIRRGFEVVRDLGHRGESRRVRRADHAAESKLRDASYAKFYLRMMSSARTARTAQSCCERACRSALWRGTPARGCIAGQRMRPTASSLRSARARAGASCATPTRFSRSDLWRQLCSAADFGPETPIVIISGNSVDHGLLALAAQYVGVPIVPLAEQYSLVPDAYPRLQHAVETVRPKMVFADDGAAYGAALALPFLDSIEKVLVRNASGGATTFADLLQGDASADVDAAHAKVGPDTLAKIIFTSGSTANPKGVLTTHGMLCVNQAQIAAAMPVVAARPPKMLDWLPWSHVFGGNHNFNLMLANGGSLYLDEGKPTKAGFAASVRNIREHAGNLAFNVPIGFAQLVAAMEKDEALKRAYLGDCDLIFYAAASVTQEIWSALAKFAKEVRGEAPLMFSGWGLSETAPSATQTHQPVDRPGTSACLCRR